MTLVLHTTHGDLPVMLHFRECPRSAFNFLALCASGSYDGCQFHRHIPGILLQTGDPTNTGKGGESVYAKIPATPTASPFPSSPVCGAETAMSAGPARFFEDEGFGVTTHSKRGVLSMAHRGNKPDTNASQFFVLCGPQPGFDGVYTAFGSVLLNSSYQRETGELLLATSQEDDEAEGSLRSGNAVLTALEEAASLVDERHIVTNRDEIRIVGATILYNPFAEGRLKL